MHQPKVAIIIIHYNTPHYLKTCLDSIFSQSYKNIEVYFIDNNSPDKGGLYFVKKAYIEKAKRDGRKLNVIGNKENLGYAKAANQGIRLALENGADYVVITNPDIIYTEKYFEKVVYRADKDKQVAGITGKVYKYDFKDKKETKMIDTVGLYLKKSFRIVDGAQGEIDEGQFDEEREVFGISGACPLYKKAALQAARITIDGTDEYFDEDFFMYKEDVDLSWRLQLLGYKFLYYPRAVAFHGRGTGVIKRETVKDIFKNRENLSKFQRYYSYRNQHLLMIKNLLIGNYFRNFFSIVWFETGTFFYSLFFERFLLKGMIEYIKLMPKMYRKRKQIMANRKVKASRINAFAKKSPSKN